MMPFSVRNSRGFSLITVIGFVSVMIIMSSGILLYWGHVRQSTILSSDSQRAENLAHFGQSVMKRHVSTQRNWLNLDTTPAAITIDGGSVSFQITPISEHQVEIQTTGVYDRSSVTVERQFHRRTAAQFYMRSATQHLEVLDTSPNVVEHLELHLVSESPHPHLANELTLFWEPEGGNSLVEIKLDGISLASGTFNSGEVIPIPGTLTLGVTHNMSFTFSQNFFGSRMTGYIRFDDQSVDVFDATF
jgi:hypothetical protein